VRDIVKNRRKKREKITEEEAMKIREAFLQFFVGVFQEYEKYIIQPQGGKGFVKTTEGVRDYFNFARYKEETNAD
jgi:hypothetical protein